MNATRLLLLVLFLGSILSPTSLVMSTMVLLFQWKFLNAQFQQSFISFFAMFNSTYSSVFVEYIGCAKITTREFLLFILIVIFDVWF